MKKYQGEKARELKQKIHNLLHRLWINKKRKNGI